MRIIQAVEFGIKIFVDGNDYSSNNDKVDTNELKMCDVTSIMKAQINNLNKETSHTSSYSTNNDFSQILQNAFSYFQKPIDDY